MTTYGKTLSRLWVIYTKNGGSFTLDADNKNDAIRKADLRGYEVGNAVPAANFIKNDFKE